jgi:hypothetical protein
VEECDGAAPQNFSIQESRFRDAERRMQVLELQSENI